MASPGYFIPPSLWHLAQERIQEHGIVFARVAVLFGVALFLAPTLILLKNDLHRLAIPSLASLFKPEPELNAPDSRGLPHIKSNIPVVGHVWSLQRSSAAYLHELFGRTTAPLFTINFMTRKVLVAHPSMDKTLARHPNDTGLAQVVSIVGKRLFDMEPDTINFIVDYDPRPQHRHEFYSALNARRLADESFAYMLDKLSPQPATQKVDFAKWLFFLGVRSTARAVWGAENPWNDDDEFMESFA
jgi:hypothetical protein